MMAQIDPVELTQTLIRCRSVTPEDGGALAALQGLLEKAGFTCHRMTFHQEGTPSIENLYARYGSQEPNLCFAGHTDVVPPGDEAGWTHGPFDGEIRDGLLFGRGAVDMKGAIAAFVSAAVSHIDRNGGKLNGSISMLITGDEEGPSVNGTIKVLKWLEERGERLQAAIVGEPTNPSHLGEEMKIGRRGSLTCELTVGGRQGHSAYPHLADNPIHKIIPILDALTSETLDSGSEHFEPSNIQVTVVSVPNSAANVIPNEARAKFNIRYNDHWTRASIESHIRGLVASAAIRVAARYDLQCQGTGEVFRTKPGRLVEILAETIHEKSGVSPRLTTGGGTSDARFIHNYCPVVEFGLVNQTMHKVNECVSTTDLRRLAEIYGSFLDRYFAN